MEEIKIATMADIEKLESVPLAERMTAGNMVDLLKEGAEKNADKTAISFMLSGDLYESPIQVTYRELITQITRTANLFHDLGIGSRDVVTYLLPNAPHSHYVLWGGEAAGIANPVNPLLEASTIRDICLAAGTKVLVALAEVPGSEIWQKVEAIRDELPDLKAIVRVFGPGDEKEGIIGFDEVINNYNGESLDSGREIDPQDIASIYHTGGTTGTPKLAPHTHYNEVAMVKIIESMNLLKPGETVLNGLPLFHVNGTIITGAVPFSIGGHVVILSPQGYRDPAVMQNFYKIVEHYKAVFFSCVPTVLSVLLDIPKDDCDISSLQYALCGAAPLSTELMTRFEEHTQMSILEGYGLTEGTTGSSVNPPFGERRVGSIGLRFPYSEMDVFIREGTKSRRAAVDEIGSICIKGPTVFNGYLDEKKNQGIWVDDGWFDTGDLGRKDAEGYFWLTGRAKDLIIRGGHNIDPAAIEDPLYKLGGVQVAAAIGRPDAHAGEVPVAYVQLQPGSNLTSESIMQYLEGEIGERAALPKEVFIVDDIPLTPIGKIFKPSLRRDAIKKVYEKEIGQIGEAITRVNTIVKEDKLHGILAQVEIVLKENCAEDEIKARIGEALSRFTVKYELIFKQEN